MHRVQDRLLETERCHRLLPPRLGCRAETSAGEVNWILETKGRVWEGTDVKEAAMHEWCARVSEQTGQVWRHARINQVEFDMLKPKTLEQATTPGMRPQTNAKSLL